MIKNRDYKAEYKNYQGKPEQIKNRAKRNAARAEMVKEHGKAALKGKDVGHKKALIHGGSNAKSNTRIETVSGNRSFKRTKTGGMKK